MMGKDDQPHRRHHLDDLADLRFPARHSHTSHVREFFTCDLLACHQSLLGNKLRRCEAYFSQSKSS